MLSKLGKIEACKLNIVKKHIRKSYQKLVGFKTMLLYKYSSRPVVTAAGRVNARNILILSATGGGNSRGLSYPFIHFETELRRQLNLYIWEITSNDLEEKRRYIDAFKGDIIILSVPVRSENGRILSKKVVRDFITGIPEDKRQKIIFFGPSDDPISPYFDILPYVRLFMLPFTFKDAEAYEQTYKGGSLFAHAVSEIYDFEPTEESEYREELFSSQAEPQYLDKLTISWNFTHWRRLLKLFDSQNNKCLNHRERPIDVSCRFNPYAGWCKKHRIETYNVLQGLSDRYNIIASPDKIPVEEYFKEIEDSKILFSPFGWGAICPKDYEAIMKGCLLMKPSIEHINIFPDVLVPYETYVPVKWDLSDLEEKIEYYLEHDDERQKIIEKAAEVYQELMQAPTFVDRVKGILDSFDSSSSV